MHPGEPVYTAIPVHHNPGIDRSSVRSDVLRELREACSGHPAIFVKYFRLYGVFPLCFAPAKGHGDELYRGILKAAERGGARKLVVWLRVGLWNRAISCCSADVDVDVDNNLAQIGQRPESSSGVPTETGTTRVPFGSEAGKKVILNHGWCTENG